MRESLTSERSADAVPLYAVSAADYEAWKARQEPPQRQWLEAVGFSAKPGSFALLPGAEHGLAGVAVGAAPADPWWLAELPGKLPPGDYYLAAAAQAAAAQAAAAQAAAAQAAEQAALGWALACYRYSRYKKLDPAGVRLALPDGCDPERIGRQLDAVGLVRDLINTPAEDMMPEHLAEVVSDLAGEFGAVFHQVEGEALLEQNYPVIHMVGRASSHPPRLLELTWANDTDDDKLPLLTLVGKGVCFDSGGLDIKPASGMRLMKKDMGGAAHAIGLARLVMAAGLPVRLRLLVAAVENAVAGNAFRPGDVVRSRQGTTVEIDNTDAEGRLILCDALSYACEHRPDLVIDFATLTGAARIALGTELPALFCNDDELAAGLLDGGQRAADPVWRMPLHAPYKNLLDSKIADLLNSATSGFGGAITAALFLQNFIGDGTPWAHYDLMAWNNRARPGRPEGGEAMGLRATFEYLQSRYGG